MVQVESVPLKEAPVPGEVAVDVVTTRLPDPADARALETKLRRYRDVLSLDERERAERYRVAEARAVFTLAHGLLRIELARRLAAPPGDIRFDLRPSGKPDLRSGRADRPDWRFSVSHSGPHVAIAFALGVDLGLDIERLDRSVNPLEIASRYFTAAEGASLRAFPGDAQRRAFFAGWTRKEAIVKARGHTMAESLATLTVDLDPDAQSPAYADAPEVADRPACRLASFEFVDQKLVGAVAIRSTARPRLRFEVLSEAAFD